MQVADVFARLYEVSLEHEPVTAVVAYDDEMFTGFAYGHRWWWAEQQDDWAYTLRERLGEAASRLDGTYALTMLARHPHVAGTGTGRAVLKTWLDGIGQAACWLQTSDMDSPATRLYQAEGFARIGHGPDAPNGEPGLVLFRNAGAR
jgi:ribosomal protein S18 acetylase RimI-like enzyme